jgi:CubicO group peptidase (beta-lactamase class C family)
MTEPLTATALMVLVEMGKLSLDDPLAKYLPEFGAMKVANNGSMSSMQEAQRQISLRNLLSHQAGLTLARRYAFDLNDVQKLYRKRGLFSKNSQLTDLGEHVSALAELPLVYQPGSRTADSVAYDVLARVVEVVADKPFEEFLNAQVLKPLAMRDTHFEVPESKRDRLAAMYEPVVWGYNVPGTPKMYRRSIVTSKKQAESGEAREAFIGGSTGLLSTASDYAKFLAFLLGEQTASAVTLSEENRRAVLYGTNNLTANTNRQTTDLGTMAGQGLGYRFKIGSSNTSFWIDPETRIAGLFLTQLNPAQFELVPLLQEAADRHFSNPL